MSLAQDLDRMQRIATTMAALSQPEPLVLVGIQRTGSGRWKAQMCRAGHMYYLGTYDTEAEALAARQAGERTYATLTGTSL